MDVQDGGTFDAVCLSYYQLFCLTEKSSELYSKLFPLAKCFLELVWLPKNSILILVIYYHYHFSCIIVSKKILCYY